jgi:His/Glu/Gln/Arg/opine family amino acid ABC transporter permease subunit
MPDWAGPVAHYMVHEGLKNTGRIAIFAVLGSTIIGVLLGTLMTIRFRPLQALIRVYIEVWRGLPILVTLFLVFYALPSAPYVQHKLTLGSITAAVVALTLWGSAQVAEATRGAVQSIPREQHEAAAALGFGWVGRHRSVILPQALRRLLPPLVSLLANIIQNTTIASLIGVTELLATGQRSVERLQFEAGAESHDFAIYGAVMLAFFCISFPLTRLAIFLERKLV